MALARQRGAQPSSSHSGLTSHGATATAAAAPGAGAHSRGGQRARGCLSTGALLLVAAILLFPLTTLVLAFAQSCTSSSSRGQTPQNWLEQANPFSVHNLCWIKSNIAGTDDGLPAAPRSVGAGGRALGEDGSTSTHLTAAPSNIGTSSNNNNSTANTATTTATSASSLPAAGASTDVSPPASSPPPRPSRVDAPAKPTQQEQEARWAAQRAANKHRQHRTAGDVFDEVELPDNDQDVERILNYPHYDECNRCKVCVPLDVVAHHPKAKAHPANKKLHLRQTQDEDVTVEVLTGAGAGQGPAGGKGSSSGKLRQQGRRLQGGAEHPMLLGRGQEGAAMGGAAVEEEAVEQRGGGGSRRYEQLCMVEVGGNGTTGAGARRCGRRRLLAGPGEKDESISDGIYHVKGKFIDIKGIAPGDTKAGPRKHLPNCSVCWGCSHTLEMMASGSVMAGSYYSHEPGGSPSWLFRVRSNRTRSGWAVVKLWCVPVRKVKQRGLAMCSPPKVFAQVKLLLAQNKVIRQCGLDSIIPAMWVEPVRGVIPGQGFRIDWLGLWADVADGASVQNIHEFGKPRTPIPAVLDLMQNRINHTEMQMVATFDVLTSQCDRHQQNLFLTESGKVWAIDNDQVFGVAWRKCGFDSMILPTSQKFMINHLGYFYVMKYPQKDPPKAPVPLLNPLMLLDYRCHVRDGVLGTNYPGPLKRCMQHLSTLTPDAIQIEYGYPSASMAEAIRNRSRDLVAHGFEWTLLYGTPTNQPQHRYKVAPACCSVSYDEKAKRYKCNTPWKQMPELPFGNPWHGGKWHGTPGKDTGTYEGGTAF